MARLKTPPAALPLSGTALPLSPAAPHARIRLLGGLRVELSGVTPVTRFSTHKTAVLLAYLALHSGRVHGREFLTDLLWPDAALDDGRRSFRTALASLRRRLEPPGTAQGTALIADRTTVSLSAAHIEVDVARFEAACLAEPHPDPAEEENRLEAALAWYGGSLLPGFYEDWVMSRRERLVDLYRHLLLRRAALAEQRGGAAGALHYARQAVLLEQDRESAGTEDVYQPAHIAVIRLLTLTGRPDEARQHYELLGERLREFGGDAPSPEARAALTLTPLPQETRPVEGGSTNSPTESAAAPLPPLPTARRVCLPSPLTRFFGRGPERDRLVHAADSACRFVTLTGVGGAGKTRLAVEWARQWSETFPAATVCFVPLADVTQARYLWTALAQAMALELSPDPAVVRARVCDALRSQSGQVDDGGGSPLLVLDNFETLVDDGAPFVESLLQAVPGLRVVVTSRRRLNVGGEHEILVGPLPVPALPGTPERLLEWAAVQLFVDRAQAARPDFQITPRSADAIAALCQRLEGIPLALEITAAWAGALSCAQMLVRLDTFLLDETGPPLAHQRAGRPARHQTLRAALQTSVTLLSPDLQKAFARLGVFRGGWTLDAAASVWDGLSGSPTDLLSRLRERSLIVAETGADGDTLRFRLLTVLREFAGDIIAPPEHRAARQKQADYFLRFAEAAETHWGGADAQTHLDALAADHENVRAALHFLLEAASPAESDNAQKGLRLAGAMARFWNLRGFWDEGLEWLGRTLALSGSAGDESAAAAARAHALLGQGRIAYQRGDLLIARAAYEEARAIQRQRGDERQIGILLLGLAGVAFHADNDYERARALTEECLALRRKLGDAAGVAAALSGLGTIAEAQGDYRGACAYFTECVERERARGDRENEANALFNLGNIAVNENRLDEAQALYEESLRIQTDLDNRQQIGHCALGLGNVALDRGDYPAAHRAYEESLRIARQIGEDWAIPLLLNNLGQLAYHENDLARARALCGESLRQRAASGDRAGVVRVLENLALIAAAQPDTHTRAVVFRGAAHRLREALGIVPAAPFRDDDNATLALRTALGDPAWAAAWTQGTTLSLDEIVAFAA